MSEPITRPEFNETVGRIHDKIDAIAKTGIQIETSAKMVEKSVEKICECVYGNSKEGITQKLTRLFERVSLHTKLIMLMIASVLGIAYFIIQQNLVK
jgi:23S rRNA U2552 (ribose-2'-O)-methylase RlmE/FtsJ